MRLTPRIAGERGADRVLRLRLDGVRHALLVGERPAQDDEARVYEPVHEGRVSCHRTAPRAAARVPVGTRAPDDDEEHRHDSVVVVSVEVEEVEQIAESREAVARRCRRAAGLVVPPVGVEVSNVWFCEASVGRPTRRSMNFSVET